MFKELLIIILIMNFVIKKGCLYLLIDPSVVTNYLKDIDQKWQNNRRARDGDKYHITIVNSMEKIPDVMPAVLATVMLLNCPSSAKN